MRNTLQFFDEVIIGLLTKIKVLAKDVTGVWGVEGLGEGEGATLSVSELKRKFEYQTKS